MRITSRRRATVTFLVLGVVLAGVAVSVGMGWTILNWQLDVKVFLGIIFFGAITAGIILNTTFLLREIRRNEQHDSFINAVTHELKTPVASIRLYLQTLQRRDVDENKRREFYRLMLDDTDRLLGTVDQVLKAGEAGLRISRPHVSLDFAGLVQECVEVTRNRHNLPAEALGYDPAPGNGNAYRVFGDLQDLRIAISNLLDNAIKYSGDRVEVSVRIESPEPKRVALSVRDRGVGIPAQELRRIFKRFYRVPTRLLPNVKGTGLGLFIVRSIAKKHGGRVFAESLGEGQGTTVILELPRSDS